ncbi:hypothetical protein QAD02_022563 [Eretmocerus hayati]|uniref:Uncharacterized protein n=1 Tax=Eretmocerus hayati TaxID=131215 RepID=A0ACC2PT44_9HYME|nr:hypothetical protein QAD02_022563 [Eretmocerus hayati]
MMIVQFLYGLFLSTEVAYYTYIYAKVDKQHYQQVTSYTRCAFLLGRFSAGLIAQLTTSSSLLDYEQLNYITAISLTLATIWSFFLPSVRQSLYFYPVAPIATSISFESQRSNQTFSSSSHDPSSSEDTTLLIRVRHAYYLLFQDFIKAYTNGHVVKWSLWWAAATCGYVQVITYIQLLWMNAVETKNQDTGDHTIYNGAVESTYTIISALAVYSVGKLHFNWPLVGEAILSIFSIIEGFLLILSYVSDDIWVLYIAYIAFGVIYHAIVTIASFEVAKHLSEDSYALIFGINMFLALLLQSVLTKVVVNNDSLHLDLKSQYLVYGGYFLVLGIIFMIMNAFTISAYMKKQKPFKIWMKSSESLVESGDKL